MPQPLSSFEGLLDWAALQTWILDSDLPGEGPVTNVEQLTGGSQNNLFLLHRGQHAMVLRRPPRHPRANSNQTMLREAQVLGALSGSKVPHPKLLAVGHDLSVLGVNFYVMSPLEGFSPTGVLPGRYAEEPSWRQSMGEAFVTAAAELAAVDYQAVGLESFGKPDNWHERQVERWHSQLMSYRDTPRYGGHGLTDVDDIGRWLLDNIPLDRRIGIIHGDLQWPNVMFSLKEPKISGLIDWELSTLGDPMLDMAWILTSWREPGDPQTAGGGSNPMVTPWDGFQSRAELTDRYIELTGRDINAMPWFLVLACFKLACLLEGTYARSLVGKAPEQMGEFLHDYALWLVAKARQQLAML